MSATIYAAGPFLVRTGDGTPVGVCQGGAEIRLMASTTVGKPPSVRGWRSSTRLDMNRMAAVMRVAARRGMR